MQRRHGARGRALEHTALSGRKHVARATCGDAHAAILEGLRRTTYPDRSPLTTRHYPLIPLRVMPWMKVRWVRKNSTMTGRVIVTEAAIISCHSALKAFLKNSR